VLVVLLQRHEAEDPSGDFSANGAWSVLATIAFNLTHAAEAMFTAVCGPPTPAT